jgi:hypothetical protein
MAKQEALKALAHARKLVAVGDGEIGRLELTLLRGALEYAEQQVLGIAELKRLRRRKDEAPGETARGAKGRREPRAPKPWVGESRP